MAKFWKGLLEKVDSFYKTNQFFKFLDIIGKTVRSSNLGDKTLLRIVTNINKI